MDRKRYYIELNGQEFEVSRELYEAYMKGYRKEKYFIHDLKKERRRVDEKTGKVRMVPGREDSYERLLEAEKCFMAEAESVGDAAVHAVMLEKLSEALHMLTLKERRIIYSLFYKEISETQPALYGEGTGGRHSHIAGAKGDAVGVAWAVLSAAACENSTEKLYFMMQPAA